MNVTLGNKVDRTEFIGLENRINDLENNTSLYALQTDTNAILNRLHNIDNYIPTKLNISEFEIHVAMKTDPHTNWYPPFEKMANQITAYRLNANGDRIMAIDSIVTDMITNENVTDEKIARLNVYGSGMNNDNQDHSHIATETIGPNNLATSSVYGYKNNGDDTDFSKSRQRSIIAYRTIGDENIDVLEIFGSVRKINNQYQINPGASKIAERTIGNYNIDDDAITSNKIAAGQIYGSWRERNGVLNSSTGSLNDSTSDIHLYTIGTNNIHDSAVTTPKIADSNVTTAKINNSAVTTEKINNSAVTTEKINNSAVTTPKIADSNVTTAKINNSAVTTEKINNSAVTTDKIANGNVTTVKLADNAVTTAKIADSNVTTAKINNSAVTTDKIANGNVTTVKLANSAVTTAKIADSNVTTAKIADRNVTTVKLADGAVTTAKIANRNVTAAKLADDVLSMFNTIEGSINVISNTVNNLELEPHSVTGTGTKSSTKSIIAGSTVGNWNLANYCITDDKIANNAVTNDKINWDTITVPTTSLPSTGNISGDVSGKNGYIKFNDCPGIGHYYTLVYQWGVYELVNYADGNKSQKEKPFFVNFHTKVTPNNTIVLVNGGATFTDKTFGDAQYKELIGVVGNITKDGFYACFSHVEGTYPPPLYCNWFAISLNVKVSIA